MSISIGSFLSVRWEVLDAVFFDFDGVIVDSVSIKADAYEEIFRSYGEEAVREIRIFHAKHGGVDRFRKIRHVLEFLHCESSEAIVADLARSFANLVKEKVVSCPLIPGVRELVEEATTYRVPTFLVSGTPEEELREILLRRELTSLFREVCGSPMTKKEHLANILRKYEFKAGKCLFFGDAVTDFEAANYCGMYFVGLPAATGETIEITG